MRRPVPVRSPSTAAAAAPAHAAEEHGAAHGEAHCPGHGPLDPPHHVNWWQGLLGVDNEKAQSPSFVNRLLWRYENKDDPCDPKNQPPPFLASALNFLVLVAILYRFGRAPINAALAKRKQAIMGDIEAAARLRRDAKKRLAEYEERFERLEETLEALKADYAAQGQREKERILAEAEERRARMKRDAEFRIEQEMKEARAQLLREAVEGAVRAAEELIRARVNATDMARMADEYLLSIGPALGGAGSGGAAAHSARSGASSISAGQPPVGGVA
jgi:F-type H+-transporting ATPase subunit b